MFLQVSALDRMAVGFRDLVVRWEHLGNPVFAKFDLDPLHQIGAGEGIEFDTLFEQEIDFGLRCPVFDKVRTNLQLGRPVVNPLGFQIVFFDVLQPKAQVDNLDLVLEFITPGVALKGPNDGEARLVEVVQDQERDVVVAA